MTLYYATGSSTAKLSSDDLRFCLGEAFRQLGPKRRVLAVPPDYTRASSRAGELTSMAYEYFGERLRDVMPALGTHAPMKDWQIVQMFPGLPPSLIRIHRWRRDVVTIGEVPGDFVAQVTEGLYNKPWPAQLNRLVWEGGHDLILSIGQVVPHEVIGMANYNKNFFVGTGGAAGINESHFLSAVYGMERIMGRADSPLRRILNYAHDRCCNPLPIVFMLSVVGTDPRGQLVTRGLFIGDDEECFQRACQLSREVNVTLLDEPLAKVVVYLDPEEFHSTWLGNKSIYRTRMAIADQGELIVLAPSVAAFGEDDQIDRLIRKYGYRTTPEILQLVRENEDLQENLSAAAHLIHGSPEGRFQITYCPGKLTRKEIEKVGYQYADLDETVSRYNLRELAEGWNELSSGERIYYISKPAMGLWAYRTRFSSAEEMVK